MANFDAEHNKGKVKRLYPAQDRLWFTLGGSGSVTAMNPKDGYYYILVTNNNFAGLYGLVYLCAEHGWTLKVRTLDNLVGGWAEVSYLVVDF